MSTTPHTTSATPARTMTAKLVRESKVQTVWLIEVPAPNNGVKKYNATTYPNSAIISLQSAARGRVIAAGNATNLLPAIREAIARARAATEQPSTGDTQ